MVVKALNSRDKKILKLADQYVREVLERRAKPDAPIDWRSYYTVAKTELAAYPRKAS